MFLVEKDDLKEKKELVWGSWDLTVNKVIYQRTSACRVRKTRWLPQVSFVKQAEAQVGRVRQASLALT